MDIKVIIIAVLALISIVALIVVLSKKNGSSKPSPTRAPTPKPLPQTNPLSKFFTQLFPAGEWNDSKVSMMTTLYMNLDCWYTPMVPSLQSAIITTLPNFSLNRMKGQWNDPPEGITWEKLFDGSICDCMRFAYPVCNHPTSRFGGKDILKDCPLWPGLNVGKTYETLLLQAYNTNNKDKNWTTDTLTVSGKGFPNNSWIEGLAYPGEYGHPTICGPLPKDLQGSQPGLTYKDSTGNYVPLNYPWSEGPWFDSACKGGKCAVSFLTCAAVKSDGSFPTNQGKTPLQGNYCLDGDALPHAAKENFQLGDGSTDDSLYAISPRSYNNKRHDEAVSQQYGRYPTHRVPHTSRVPKTTLPPSMTNPDVQGFHGFWLYPLRGVGMWRNVGNTVICNTKLGYLLSPVSDHGAGLKIADLVKLVGSSAGGPQNIGLQVTRLTQLIQTGKLSKTSSYPALTLTDLNVHIYAPLKKITKPVRNAAQAKDLALSIISRWYVDGYNGMSADKSSKFYNGFNYNYQLFFPLGTQFGYAAQLDTLVLSIMVQNKIDTLQLVAEPQAAKAGLRPGYFFEIFQATPPKAGTWSVYTDTHSDQCKSFFMIDPSLDFDNYTKYGYVSGSKVKNPQVFNPLKMTLNAASPSVKY